MYFTSVQDLLFMNGHGIYVWSAYAIGFTVLAGLIWLPLARHKRLQHEILRHSIEEK